MLDSTAVSSAGPGRDVSHADASDATQLRKRARSARAVDRTCEEDPFASASSVAKRAAVRASASAWEIARGECVLGLCVCDNRDGWLVAWGFCGCVLSRFSTVRLLPFTLL